MKIAVPHRPVEGSGIRASVELPRRTGAGLALVSLAILGLGGVIGLGDQLTDGRVPDGLVTRFGLNGEGGLPAAWSALLLLGIAALLVLEAVLRRRDGGREWRWWAGLAVLFVALGAEEFLAVHELTIGPLRSALGVGGLLYYAWVIPGVVVLVALCAVFARFVDRMPADARRPILAGALLMAAGGLGMESLGGWWVSRDGDGLVRVLLFVIEEALEIAGATLTLAGLLLRLDGTRLVLPALRP